MPKTSFNHYTLLPLNYFSSDATTDLHMPGLEHMVVRYRTVIYYKYQCTKLMGFGEKIVQRHRFVLITRFVHYNFKTSKHVITPTEVYSH